MLHSLAGFTASMYYSSSRLVGASPFQWHFGDFPGQQATMHCAARPMLNSGTLYGLLGGPHVAGCPGYGKQHVRRVPKRCAIYQIAHIDQF